MTGVSGSFRGTHDLGLGTYFVGDAGGPEGPRSIGVRIVDSMRDVRVDLAAKSDSRSN